MSSITITEYYAERSSRFNNEDAKKIGPVLSSLAEEGGVTSRDVLDAAKSTNSPLHSYFEWRDTVAADLYRLEQARYMLKSIRVRFQDGAEVRETRAFQVAKVRAYEEGPRRYRTFQVLHGDSAFAAQMMDSAVDDLLTWRRKYEPYTGMWKNFGDVFQGVINQIDEFQEEFKSEDASAETDAALAKLLTWKEECADVLATWTAAREQVEFIMGAIKDAETVFALINEKRERNCLKCSKPFQSVSTGNRICKTCLNSKTVNECGSGATAAMSWDG